MTSELTITIEDAEFDINYCPGTPDKLWGHPDSWHPGDPGEVEITEIRVFDEDEQDWRVGSFAEAIEAACAEDEDELMSLIDQKADEEHVSFVENARYREREALDEHWASCW